MAKKSSKSTRRARAKKQETGKKKSTPKVTKVAAITTEGSDEPVVKTVKETPKKTTTAEKSKLKKIEEPELTPEVVAATKAEAIEAIEDSSLPNRRRMLVSTAALGVIIVALIFGAAIIRQQSSDRQSEMVKSGQVSGKADEILQSGGNVCTNGSSQTDTTGSSNPQSVGMMLQTNPVSSIQTPQTLGGGNDASTLQGASCF